MRQQVLHEARTIAMVVLVLLRVSLMNQRCLVLLELLVLV